MLFRRFISCFWLQALIQCSLFKFICCSCRFPSGVIEHGKIVYEEKNDEKKDRAPNLYSLKFKCYRGYRLAGANISRCIDGKWTSEVPVCEKVFCRAPKPPANGYIPELLETNLSTFPYNSTITYFCNEGYMPETGEYTSKRCSSFGWVGRPFNCIACRFPGGAIEHGKVVYEEKNDEKKDIAPNLYSLKFKCYRGYILAGANISRCIDGRWTSEVPVCETCRFPSGAIEHGKIVYEEKNDEKKDIAPNLYSLKFKCYRGYRLDGAIISRCIDGKWTSEFPVCEKVFCEAPKPPANGFIPELLETNLSTFPYNYTITYFCYEGYRPETGEYTSKRCSSFGWVGGPFNCIDIGQYNFDNGAQVRDILKSESLEKADEQNSELPKSSPNTSASIGGILDTNFPGRLILYFVFDVTRSVEKHNFDKSIEFAKALVQKVGISEKGTRAGALVFNNGAEIAFLPVEFKTTEDVLDALDEIKYTNDRISGTSVFPLIRKECIPLSQEVLGTTTFKNVIFILTDGKTTMGGHSAAIEEANLLKQAGDEIYCIGVSNSVKVELLNSIASTSNEDNPNVFILHKYASVFSLVQEIMKGEVDYSQCGLRMGSAGMNRGRIIGGNKSEQPWPWMAALYMRSKKSDRLYTLQCGGSIITEKFILTAAHCMYYSNFEEMDKGDIKIKLGLTDVKNETHLQEYEVEKILIHPKFERHGTSFDYDIALLQLDRQIVFNAFVRPICLPPKELPRNSALYSSNEFSIAIGWGYNQSLSFNSKEQKGAGQYLKEVSFPIQPTDKCIESLNNNKFNVSYFTNQMFCAGDGRGGNDTCKGDSGGPLMQLQQNLEGYPYWTQVGIISWGMGCGLKNTYGYYSHVQRLRPWIDQTILNARYQMFPKPYFLNRRIPEHDNLDEDYLKNHK